MEVKWASAGTQHPKEREELRDCDEILGIRELRREGKKRQDMDVTTETANLYDIMQFELFSD